MNKKDINKKVNNIESNININKEEIENEYNFPIHRGEIVKKTILQKGKKLLFIANSLKIKRQTLYTRLLNPNISNFHIREIGKIIGYDFSEVFPDVEKINIATEVSGSETYNLDTERKYAKILEKNNNLYEFIMKIYHMDNLDEIKKLIKEFFANK